MSYVNSDADRVRELVARLESAGFSSWMFEKDLRGGDKWEEETNRAMLRAGAVIVCLSRASAQGLRNSSDGRHYQKEIEFALRLDSLVIPVRLEETEVPEILSSRLAVDLYEEQGFERLLEVLQQSLPNAILQPAPPLAPEEVVDASAVKSSSRERGADKPDRGSVRRQRAKEQSQSQAQPTAFPGELLHQGSKGDDVANIQRRLKDLGFNVTADGNFGRSTRQAVLAFQKAENLRSKDGMIGPNTWAALFSQALDDGSEVIRAGESGAKPAVGPAADQPVKPHAQTDTQPQADARKSLRRNSKGEEVRVLQQRLKDLGFDLEVDGTFGPGTERTVVAFQTQNNLTADGIVGPDTWVALDTELLDEHKLPHEPGIEIKAEPVTVQSIKEGLAEEARERNALNDKPIDNFENDTLNFKDYVLALRDFVASQSTTTPLSISINGAWGSGKSSLMRMLQLQLEPDLTGLWRIQIRWLAGWFWRTFFGGKPQVEPNPPAPLWLVKLRWLAGWCVGTFFWVVGHILMKAGVRNSEYIRLGFAFDPPTDVTKHNFKELFGKFVDYSLKESPANPEEREWRLKNARLWARQSARRRKMTPMRHPTVWFNAWKFNEQEQVWAALATAVLNQLKRKYGFFARLVFVSQLAFKRTDKLGTLKHFLRKFAVPLILAAVVAIYQLNRGSLPAYLNLPSLAGPWFWLSNRLVWLAPALAAMWQALKAIDDPFKLPTEELIEQPNYKTKIGFIGTFEDDFQRIVKVAVRRSIFWQPRKLVIFIDDLDRCSPAQTAGIIEAINLFLDSVGCVFVLGMDVNAVAISIEVKYKDLAERMRQDAPDSVSPGVLFLDKIVQIPFNVPRPNRDNINALVTQITKPAIRKLPAVTARFNSPAPAQRESSSSGIVTGSGATELLKNIQAPATYSPAPVIDRAGFAQGDIRDAIAFASNLLKENPRQVKRFINLFRLQVYVADARKMLSDGNDFGLTPRKLAVWVAWYMQWPDIVKLLSSAANGKELSEYLLGISRRFMARVSDQKPDAGWRLSQMGLYLEELRQIRKLHEDELTHWSHMPWPLWIRDYDFLQSLKELEVYWGEPELLDSILDMTQVTVTPNAALPLPAVSPKAETVAGVPPGASGIAEEIQSGVILQ
jgi:peptidoglycan hydrolase-like protein with peptidoglycan-binding domain